MKGAAGLSVFKTKLASPDDRRGSPVMLLVGETPPGSFAFVITAAMGVTSARAFTAATSDKTTATGSNFLIGAPSNGGHIEYATSPNNRLPYHGVSLGQQIGREKKKVPFGLARKSTNRLDFLVTTFA
jgi:hypothetical protein